METRPSAYQQIVICYFSGTGNAKAAAQWLAEEATAINIPVKLVDIPTANPSALKPTEDSLIGFCSPTHGFNMAPLVLKFIAAFPRNPHASNKVFLLNTRAGMKMSKMFLPGLSGLALFLPALILWLKGYGLQGFRPLDMPSNWISLHPGLRPIVVASIVKRCDRKCREFGRKLFSGKRVRRGWWDLLQDILISPVAVGYYFYGRFVLAKTFIATKACSSCGRCERDCPVQAIEMRGKYPFWTHKCESCMHCMNHCPKRAIETPFGMVFLTWWLAFSMLPLWLLDYLFNADWWPVNPLTHMAILNKLLSMLAGMVVVYLAYKLTHYLMRFPFFNSLIAYTSLTRFSFWRRYGGPGVEQS